MKPIFSFLKRTKIIIFSLLIVLALIVLSSTLAINQMSGFSVVIHHIQNNLMMHKTLLLVSHMLVFFSIFLTGFYGFKKAAIKRGMPDKHINAFAYLMGLFFMTIIFIDLLTFFF